MLCPFTRVLCKPSPRVVALDRLKTDKTIEKIMHVLYLRVAVYGFKSRMRTDGLLMQPIGPCDNRATMTSGKSIARVYRVRILAILPGCASKVFKLTK